MATVSKIAVEFSSRGAGKIQKDNQRVQKSVSKTARTAKKETSTISDWMDANKTALMAMGAAAAGAMYGIIKASPTLTAELGSARLGFQMLAMEMGEHLAPIFEAISDVTWKLYDAFVDLSPVSQKLITILVVGLVAVAASMAIYTAATMVASGATAILGATIMGTPVGWILAAIVGIVAVLIVLEEKFGFVTKAVKALKKGFNILIKALRPIYDFIKDSLLKAWQGIKDIIEAVKLIFSGLVKFLKGDGKGAMEDWAKAGELITKVWNGLVDWFKNLGKKIWNAIKDLPDKFRKWAIKMLNKAINTLIGVIDFFKELPGNILKSLSEILPVVIPKFVELIEGIKDKFMDMIKDAYQWGIDLIKELVSGAIKGVTKFGSDIKDSLADKIGFDVKVNDKMAERWGSDMMSNFVLGATNVNLTPITGMGQSVATNSTSVVNISPGAIQVRGGSSGANNDIAEQIAKEIERQVNRR